jgi:hypothetical protein
VSGRLRGLRLSFVALLLVAIGQLLKGITSGDSAVFDHVVGLSNVYAFILAALVLVVQVGGPVVERLQPEPGSETLNSLADDIAYIVRDREGVEFESLLGGDRRSPKVPKKIFVEFRRRELRHRQAGGARIGTQATIAEYYARLVPGRMVILGEGGSGKTVLAIELLLAILKQRLDLDSAGSRRGQRAVPVRFSLATYEPNQPLDRWLAEQLSRQFSIGRRAARALVAKDRILPILDGLDEMDAIGADSVRRVRAVRAMNSYSRGGEAAPLVVTCRSEQYDILPEPIFDATEVETEPLDAAEVVAYLTAQFSSPEEELAWMDVVAILKQEDSDLATDLTHILSTPWMLTLAWTVCRKDLSPSDVFFTESGHGRRNVRSLREVRNLLLDRFIPAMVGRANALGREQHSETDVSLWLTRISRELSAQRHLLQLDADVTLHTWWRTTLRPPIHGSRWHRALSGNWIRLVHGIGAALVTAVAEAAILSSVPPPYDLGWTKLGRYLTDAAHLEPTFLGALIIVAVGSLVLPVLAGWTAATNDPAPSQLGLRGLRAQSALRILILTVGSGLSIGLAGGAAIRKASGFAISLRLDLLIGGVGGALAGLAFGLIYALERGANEGGGPLAVIRGNLLYGMAYGLSVGAIAGIGTTIAIGPIYGLVVGLAMAVVFGLMLGPVMYVRYVIAVIYMTARHGLPLRFAGFLDWAADAGLMRRVGTSFQFRHREFQEWLITDQQR